MGTILPPGGTETAYGIPHYPGTRQHLWSGIGAWNEDEVYVSFRFHDGCHTIMVILCL